jgi:hypothetical protein
MILFSWEKSRTALFFEGDKKIQRKTGIDKEIIKNSFFMVFIQS